MATAMQAAQRRIASLVSAELEAGLVSLRWADGLRKVFHPLWLRDNCASRRHPGTRQRLFSAADLPPALRVAATEATDDMLHVQWEPEHASSFCATWLRGHGTHADAASHSPATPEIVEELVAEAARASAPPAVTSIAFDELRSGGEETRWRWLRALAEDGATLLHGVPAQVLSEAGGAVGSPTTDGVRFVAELIGPLQPNIYGDIFDVVSKGDAAENLAYTSEAIGPHMDLCYYESPPGLQLLHCLQFDPDVDGGGSLLIDAFRVADCLRAAAPSAFSTLARVPATFLKDHSRRAHPVLLSYQRPHLAVDPRGAAADGRLTGVFWSPPFEGPLVGVAPHDVGAYYASYRALYAGLEAAPRWERRLQPGEMLVFNNRRMLHGRAAFEAQSGGGRHLRGCYVNIDEYANALNLLRRRFEDPAAAAAAPPPLGNQDWATGPIALPSEQHA